MDEPQRSEKNVTFHISSNDKTEEADEKEAPVSFLNVPYPENNGVTFGNISSKSRYDGFFICLKHNKYLITFQRS